MATQSTHVCSVCFTSNVRMYRIEPIGLQEISEKVTSAKLNTDERPVTMCYICLPQLQKSHRSLKMGQTAEESITNRIEVKNDSLGMLNQASIQHLANESSQVAVKEELVEARESADINHFVKIEINEQNFKVEESMISKSNDEATSYSLQITVKEEQDEVKGSEAKNNKKDEMDQQNVQKKESNMASINSNNDDSLYAKKGQIDIEKNTNKKYEMAKDVLEQCQTESISPKNTYKTITHYGCDYCGTQCKTRNSLYLHIKGHMAIKPVSCNVCAKTFSYSCKLKQHMRTHTGEKPYSCNRCNKAFTMNSSLQKHLGTHTGEKPFSCNTCKKAFIQKSNLNQHMRTHTGEKPYACNSCDKVFSQHSHLRQHMRIHTGDRPHACNKCTKTFISPSNLLQHMRTHTGEKPYSCNRCDKGFSQQSHLKQHMRIHTGDRPHSCN